MLCLMAPVVSAIYFTCNAPRAAYFRCNAPQLTFYLQYKAIFKSSGEEMDRVSTAVCTCTVSSKSGIEIKALYLLIVYCI